MRGLLGERRARRKAAAAAVAQRGAPLRQAGAACGPLPCAITDASPLRQTASARAANRRVAAMVARLFAMRGAAAQRAAMLKGGESAREQHRSKPRASRAGADASCAAARGERMRLTAACSRLPSSSRRRPPPHGMLPARQPFCLCSRSLIAHLQGSAVQYTAVGGCGGIWCSPERRGVVLLLWCSI